ncbi:hypothetical protein RI367_005053 [Sorochytrium milnesiophthora]
MNLLFGARTARLASSSQSRPDLSLPLLLLLSRSYAKKAKQAKQHKEQDAGGKRASDVEESDILNFAETERHLAKQVEHLEYEFAKLKLGRTTPGMLDSVMVKQQKQAVPLVQLAQVAIKDANTLLVIASDETYTKAIDNAIRTSGLSLSSMIETPTQLRVKIPKPTGELRESMVKQVHKMTETVKQRIRNVRQEEQKKAKKGLRSGVSEDDIADVLEKLQHVTDKYTGTIDNLSKIKVKEITES